MFDKWKPVEVVNVHKDKAEVIEFKNGSYRKRMVDLDE